MSKTETMWIVLVIGACFSVFAKYDEDNYKTHFQRIRKVQEVLWDFRVGCYERSRMKLFIIVVHVCRELLF